jgi:membrane protein DedA with SNARE-associated domain/rhodanese-related sulfurtransferase
MLQELMSLMAQYGLLLVFVNVLVEQLGVPLPAMPTLIVAGALASDGKLAVLAVFAVSFAACIMGDGLWYWAGRHFGRRVLKLLCLVSLSPDSCVSQSEVRFVRWGSSLLIVAKFIPGLSTMAPPMAGALRLGWVSFLLFDSIGTIVWIGSAIGAGLIFHTQIDALFAGLKSMGTIAFFLIAGLLLIYILIKWWERQRLYKALRMARINANELQQMIDAGGKPVIADVRSSLARAIEHRRIPGALPVTLNEVDALIGHLPNDSEIILYCSCPNEESAARAAKILINHGYTRVRPLHGGVAAWEEAGYVLEN